MADAPREDTMKDDEGPESPDEQPPTGEGEPPAAPHPGMSTSGEPPWYDGTVEVLVSGQRPLPESPAARGERPPPLPAAAIIGKPLFPDVARPWLEDRGELAVGGMSEIRRVHDRSLRRQVAVKILKQALSRKPDTTRRFWEEAQITGQLDHPNIPPIYDLWQGARSNLCFSMKLVKGQTLTQLIAAYRGSERSEESLERLLRIFLTVCDAVSFAHSRGVIHRDLKPENIMVGTHGQVYVMDWGCALVHPRRQAEVPEPVSVQRDVVVESLDGPGMAIGTASYMAPEQALARSDLVDERTDVYLLGGVLYEILTGVGPHLTEDLVKSLERAQRNDVRPPEEQAGEALPPDLCRITMRALAADRDDRYPTVASLKEDVERSLRLGLWFATATFAPGELVVKEGDPADAAYIITGGTCEAFRIEDGQRVSLRQMGPGEAFGETAILVRQPRTANVEAVDEVTTIVVTRETLERGMGGDTWLGAVVRALAERFTDLDAQLVAARREAGGDGGCPDVPPQ